MIAVAVEVVSTIYTNDLITNSNIVIEEDAPVMNSNGTGMKTVIVLF